MSFGKEISKFRVDRKKNDRRFFAGIRRNSSSERRIPQTVFPNNKLPIPEMVLSKNTTNEVVAETKTDAIKETPAIGIPELKKAQELLIIEDTSNPYIADASGFVSQLIAEVDPSDYPDRRVEEVASILAEHSVQTGNNQLAEHFFRRLSPADKWLLYSTAYKAATIDINKLANWRVTLDNDEETSRNTNPIVNAARQIALTEITLHNYRSTTDPQLKQEHQQYAFSHKKACNDTINALPWESNVIIKQYKARLSMAFSQAGLWQDETPSKQRIGKALAGELSMKDHYRLRKAGVTGEVLLWINAQRKGLETETPKLANMNYSIQNQALLEELAPNFVTKLDLRPTSWLSQLKMALATGTFEQAEFLYNAITGLQPISTKIQASLLMTKHLYDLEVATAAHEVYGNAFKEELDNVATWITEETPKQKVIHQRLEGLYTKAHELLSPQESIMAYAQLAHLYRSVAPDAKQESTLNMIIQDKWTVFEQHEGNDEQLTRLAESLQGVGFQFIKRWKRLDKGGYMGFEPILVEGDPLSHEQTPDMKTQGTYVPESLIPFWEQAAQEFNTVLGEKRYIVVRHDDARPIQGEGFYRGQDERCITLHGSWSNYDNYNEIYYAVYILDRRLQLNSMPELTTRLDELMTPVIMRKS